MRITTLLLGTLLVLVAGCGYGNGNGNGDGNGDCPDMTGTWQVTDHCEPDVIGTTASVTQNGCDITSDWEGVIFTGTVGKDGNTTIAQQLDGGSAMVCTGAVSGNTWTVDCTPDACHVVTQKL